MGVVHLARQDGTDRSVALKLIRPDLLHFDKARARFKREVEAVARLDHPGICTVYEAGEIDGTPFVAMRYVQGRTLGSHLREARADPDSTPFANATKADLAATVERFEKIARALHAAHESGVLHRDVKPGNIMIDEDGEPVVLDFGLARPEQSTGDTLTASGDQLGTPAYMSPEQISGGGGPIDRRTDVYSLGVSLYESLAGRHPFEAPTREQLYQRILAGRPVAVERCNRHVPADLAIVVQTAMATERDGRYETAQAFADDLRRVREHEPILARRPTIWQRLARWTRREPVAAGLSAALFLIAGASVWFAVLSEQNRRAADSAEQIARRESTTAQRVAEFLIELFKVADGSEYRGSTITARELLDQGYRRIVVELAGEPAIRASLMTTMARVYQHLGVYDRARALLGDAAKLHREIGSPPLAIAENERLLGELHHFEDDAATAEKLYRQSLATLAAAGEGEGRAAAEAIDLIGRARRDVGDFVQAEELHERALRLRRALPDNELDLANSYQSLGLLAMWQADHETALRELGRAVELRRGLFGPQSSRLPELMHAIGNAHHMAGEVEKARASIEAALDLSRRVFGEHHHAAGFCLSMLGLIAADQKQPEIARQHYEEAKAVFETFYGPGTREVATQTHNLGTIERDVGNYERALELLQEALVMRQKIMPELDEAIGQSYHAMATIYRELGKRDECIANYRKACSIHAQLFGDGHPETQWILGQLVRHLREAGAPDAEAFAARIRSGGK